MTAKKKTPEGNGAKKPATRKSVSKKKTSNAVGAKRAPVSKKKAPAKEDTQANINKSSGFPIVGIGASAGGLEALQSFFNSMTSNSGIAFVLVVHLDPSHVSMLPELIQKQTKMPVLLVEDGVAVEPNRVFVIPPNKSLSILHGRLHLMDLPSPRGITLPIDSFLRSLAQDQGGNAICIILSGTGTDGTIGLKAIKGNVGMAMVQDEKSAKYEGMPRSAINTGLVDYVLPPHQMPAQLLKYTRHIDRKSIALKESDPMQTALQKIFIILRARTDHDFSLYKKNTICRRIERRMNVHQIDDILDYVHYLQESEREAGILFKELLIGVTSFFRDPEAFKILQTKVFPKLLDKKPMECTVRVWVAGCATGEEAYSVAIALHEYMELSNSHYNVQIFGTDIDEDAIDVARGGLFPASIEGDVGPERIKRFFVREEDGQYRVKKLIREMLVFAPQNVIKDPPFTKLDLLCCRNLLIYLGQELQRQLLPIFNYSLNPGGMLFLGSSETIGTSSDLFTPLNKKWKIFSNKRSESAGLTQRALQFPTMPDPYVVEALAVPDSVKMAEEVSALQMVETILHRSSTPPCAIINDASNVVYIHGQIGNFLEPPEGKASVNVLEMARPGLKSELASAIRQVSLNKQEIYYSGLKVSSGHSRIFVDMKVMPILEQSAMHGLMMVSFEEVDAPVESKKLPAEKSVSRGKGRSIEELEQELRYSKESLQTTIEEMETSNEELKSTNEELQSTNEELQSTNEELETSKEELQSLNEESATVNAELQSRIDDLSEINDDMKNLLDSTEIATIFLDQDLRVRRFTPKSTDIIPLTATDSGRPIKHLASSLIGINLDEYGKMVLSDLAVREVEVESDDGSIYMMRVRPYRTAANVIDGIVITFENITVRKRAEMKLAKSELLYRSLFEMAHDSIAVINPADGSFLEFNQRAHTQLGHSREEFQKLTILDIAPVSKVAELSKFIKAVMRKKRLVQIVTLKNKDDQLVEIKIDGKFIDIGAKKYLLATWDEVKSFDANE